MRIPKRFKLLGRNIEVEWCTDLIQDRDWLGAACYLEGKIRLQETSKVFKIPRDNIEHTYCHELVHWLFYMSNTKGDSGDSLHTNEVLVDLVGGLLHQALTTAEYK